MDRLTRYFEDPFEEPPPPEDFYEVVVGFSAYEVSAHVAAAIVAALDRLPPPRWITFRDLAGATHRVLALTIRRISESTATQRAARRAIDRMRQREEKDDKRPWEDDD